MAVPMFTKVYAVNTEYLCTNTNIYLYIMYKEIMYVCVWRLALRYTNAMFLLNGCYSVVLSFAVYIDTIVLLPEK